MRNPNVLLGATWLTIGTIIGVSEAIKYDEYIHAIFKNYIKPTFPFAQESLYKAYFPGKCKKTFGNRHRGTWTRGLELDILKRVSNKPICWVWI